MRPSDARSFFPLSGALLFASMLLVTLRALKGSLPLLGRLPGDITVVFGTADLYLPVTTGLLVAAVTAAIAYLIIRLFTDKE